MSSTKIEWATKVWNPVTGCTPVSEGCQNCYAKRFAERLKFNPKIKGKYSEGFRVHCHPNELPTPMQWKKPQRIFVCSMGDLFHDEVPFEFIDAIFRVMHDIDRHTYIILTKRPQRLYDFYTWKSDQLGHFWTAKENVWIGVSVENQEQADIRIPILIRLPIFKRIISCEPLLGKIDFIKNLPCQPEIDWVITGGESGPGSRPSHPNWVRSLRDQCIVGKVPFFFKGWGEYKPLDIDSEGSVPYDNKANPYTLWENKSHEGLIFELLDEDGEFMVTGDDPKNYQPVKRLGKKASGNLLDWKEWNQIPETNK